MPLPFDFVEVASTFWQRFDAPSNFSQHTNVDEALDLAAGAIWLVNASRAWPQMVASVHD